MGVIILKKVKLLHRTPKGKLIGITSVQPQINSFVFFKDGKKKIGKIYDIFGPANKPYVKIIPLNDSTAESALKSQEAYISNEDKKRRNKRDSGKRFGKK
ncbi:Gar1/Naf1 family protein [Methanococcus aeolicus]|jgi:RNA-binding protein|uniref:H/ACA RNA-protein complex component Gar1 n=1 Tax=Methanococcus aeolicus (strain ATCC BAA-1280 / DSM 17508 / OCM 812 / Nankai-3) TaxID=419665 RepID=A6UW61_META3|nr:Gar1/Naf1 family protein [Methanococcus aeolicus]ABR56733.1 conserved hypothetical protein [Methanococcus aeolicus Nankai-3]UXM84733.1 Gar1/Naf1 family protein [Methanococcus aeolicus]